MATFVTNYSDSSTFHAAVNGGPDLLAFDENIFLSYDSFILNARTLDANINGDQTTMHRSGSLDDVDFSGEFDNGGNFHAVGNLAAPEGSWVINGLVVELSSSDSMNGALSLVSTAGLTINPSTTDNLAAGTINRVSFHVSGPDFFSQYDFTGAIVLGPGFDDSATFNATQIHLRTISGEGFFEGTIGGAFAISPLEVISGNITSLSMQFDGATFEASGFSITASSFFAAVNADDAGVLMEGVFSQILKGNDSIEAGTNGQTLKGYAGNDVFNLDDYEGVTLIELVGGGTDTVRISVNTLPDGILFDNVENAELSGSAYDIEGNALANKITGNLLLDNRLDGGAGADLLIGGSGNDWYWIDNAGDKLGAESADNPLTDNEYPEGGLDAVYATVSHILGANYEYLFLENAEGPDNFNGTGNALENFLGGNSGNNVLSGMDGNDEISGNGGNDSMLGGKGHDQLSGSGGNDLLDGGDGNDQMNADSGNNTVLGGLGDDSITTGSGNDSINAGDGSNSILAGEGMNTIASGSGNDQIVAGSFNDSVSSGAGDDQVAVGGGNNTIIGGLGHDQLVTQQGTDKIDGGDGNDIIDGGEGSDSLTGGAGDDSIFAGNTGANSSDGGTGNDLITDTAGSSTILGGAGNDTISGVFSFASINGGDGNDSISGPGGFATILGGGGNDTIQLSDDSNSVDGGAGIDTLIDYGGEGTFTLSATTENLTFTDSSFGGNGTGNALGNVFTSGLANDTFTGLAGNDTYNVSVTDGIVESTPAGGGRDLVVTDTSMTLGGGLEDLTYLGIGGAYGNAVGNVMTSGELISNSLIGLGGNDTYNVQSGDSVQEVLDDSIGGSADLVIATLEDGQQYSIGGGGEGIENLTLLHSSEGTIYGYGNTQNNVITGAAGANVRNFLYGQDGTDLLKGGAGNDMLDGGNSNDGIDTLVGGAGDDVIRRYLLSTAPGVVALLNDSMDGGAGSDTVFLGRLDGDTMASVVSVSLAAAGFGTMENINAGEAGPSNFNLTGNAGNNSLWGGNLDDSLSGGAGNDWLDGGAGGSDSLNGGAGDDSFVLTLTSVEGTATLSLDTVTDTGTGGLGDTLVLTGGFDTMAATFTYTVFGPIENVDASGAASNVKVNLTGTTGNNRLIGTMNQDTFNGGLGNDTYGVNFFLDDSLTPFADQILGETDTLTGGTDLVIAYLSNNQSWTLGEGLENLKLVDVTVETTLFGNGNGLNNVITGELLTGAYNVLSGYEGNDVLIGGFGGNQLNGDGGNDTLTGGAGSDFLTGGLGNDKLDGGLGDDHYFVNLKAVAAGALEDAITDTGGNDWLTVYGNDTVTGFTYAMTAIDNFKIYGSNAGAKITGNAGDNEIIGGFGGDSLVGGAGNDSLDGGEGGNNTLLGGAGNDWLDGGEGAGNDSLDGGLGNDTYVGSSGNNIFVIADADDNVVDGGEGGIESLILSATGNQAFLDLSGEYNFIENLTYTGAASVEMEGTDSSNSLVAGAGNDEIDGHHGTDTLVGNAGNDTLWGGYDYNPADTLTGMGFADSLSGGLGNDKLDGAEGADTLMGGDGNDWAYGGESRYDGDSLFWIFDGADSIEGGKGDDTLDGGEGGNDTLLGGDGNDSLYGGSDIGGPWTGDSMDGGIGNDTLNGGSGADSMAGSAGNDLMSGGNENDTLLGGDGNDSMAGNDGDDSLSGGAGNDTLDGGTEGFSNTMDGGAGSDTYFVRWNGDIIVNEQAGAAGGVDTAFINTTYFDARSGESGTHVEKFVLWDNGTILFANAQANSIAGGGGNDFLAGAGGNDTVSGGDGSDTFVLGWASDTITGGNVMAIKDFDAFDGDKIGLNMAGEAGFFALGSPEIPGAIVNGTAANEDHAQLVYDFKTGSLYYDSDGTGATAKILVATFDAASRPIELHGDDFVTFSGF